MTREYKTDLQIAQDLERLSDTISHAVDYANRTLEEAKKVPELKQMLSKADLTRTSIENASNVLVNINATIDSKVNKIQEIESHIQDLKDLISTLNSMKIQSDRAEILLSKINPAYSSLQEISNEMSSIHALEKYLQIFVKCRNTKQLFRILWRDFGIAGIFIYLLIGTIPKNSTIKSLLSKS